MSQLSNCLFILFLTIQWLGFVLPAPTVSQEDISQRLGVYEMEIGREDDLLPELEIQLLRAQMDQDGLEVLRMQLMQLNLLKLLIALDCFILLCIFFYAREQRFRLVQVM
ncbi:uncharacterized protein LOC108041391 isoform X2 [Drosophila rhopaloa]|uniref:Uncharacterized protein LOC108041391 isoform X2 n=1 Tax=Drosophila rhopaloa TaxID=1041015 RepID=A0A6P4END7_DRORH|nr:uncharacterized protein LOC108041391 isoform X2 [Drosophila rhopaloa]